ncbi:MAG: RluA family pseudouridine synthase [Clostridiaceae bacterium]
MRPLTLAIDESTAGRTVKSLLKNELAASDAHISRLKRRENGLLLNGARCYVTARVQVGDVLAMEIGDEPDGHIMPMAFPLDVRFEDEYLLVIDKPAGIAVHQSTRDPEELTLENAVCHYLGGNISPHPVSRLDRGTSGLMLFAKSGYLHERFRRMLHSDVFCRIYEGIALGKVEPENGRIERPIGMAEGSTYRRAVAENGAPALTTYETLAQSERFTLLRLVPHTGKTHQLRVHLASIGYPLAGDWLYGTKDLALIARPALHSCFLALTHPITGERIELAAELPEDMRVLTSDMIFYERGE